MSIYAIELKVKPFLICQKANREEVKWILEGLNKPMGVSTYTDNLMRMVEEHLDVLQVVTDKKIF